MSKDHDWDLASVLLSITDGFVDFAAAMAQLALNSDDENATSIVFKIFKRKGVPCVSIIDDGDGAGSKGRDCLTSLGKTTKTANGATSGWKGNGGRGIFRHADLIRIETKTAGERLHAVSLTLKEFLKLRGRPANWEVSDLPVNHDIRATGTMITLTGLGAGDEKFVDPKHPRTAHRLIERLAQHLPPDVAEKVTVVDEKGQSHAIKKRKMSGDPIVLEAKNLPHAGDMTFTVYVMNDTIDLSDGFEIAGRGKSVPVRTFLRPMLDDERYVSLARPIMNVLGDPRVLGTGTISKLNRYKATDARGFLESLYDDEDLVLEILTWIRKHVIEKVEALLGQKADEIVTDDDETFLDAFYEQWGGKKRTSKRKSMDDLSVSPTYSKLERGQTVMFEIREPKPEAAYAWDTSACGGSLDDGESASPSYEAGEEDGTFRLVVTETTKAGKRSAEIVIEIVEKLPLCFDPHRLHLDVNEQRTITLENVHNTSGKLVCVQDNSGCKKVEIASDQQSVTLVTGGVDGDDYDITVYDKADPTKKAVVSIVIERGHKDKMRTRKTRAIEYNGKEYEIRFVQVVPNGAPSGISIDTTATTISLLKGHQMFLTKTLGVKLEATAQQVSAQIAAADLGSGATYREINALAGEIYSTFVKKKK